MTTPLYVLSRYIRFLIVVEKKSTLLISDVSNFVNGFLRTDHLPLVSGQTRVGVRYRVHGVTLTSPTWIRSD